MVDLGKSLSNYLDDWEPHDGIRHGIGRGIRFYLVGQLRNGDHRNLPEGSEWANAVAVQWFLLLGLSDDTVL